MTSVALRDYNQRPADWMAGTRLCLRFLYAPGGQPAASRPWTPDDPVVVLATLDLADVVRAAALPGDPRNPYILEAVAQSERADGSDLGELLGLSAHRRGLARTALRDAYVALDYEARLLLDPSVRRKPLDENVAARWAISRNSVKAAVLRCGAAAADEIATWRRAPEYDEHSVGEALVDLAAQVSEALRVQKNQ